MSRKIVCYGDSNTWGYDPRSWLGERYEMIWPESLAEKTGWEVMNLGENGREIPAKGETFPPDTDLLIVMLGTNDLLQGKTAEAAAAKMAVFLDTLTLPPDRIMLIAPPPMTLGAWVPEQQLVEASKQLTCCYREMAAGRGIGFLDAGQWGIPLAYDGVHFTEEGHKVFAECLYNSLESVKRTKMQLIVDTIPLVNVDTMREADTYTIASFVPSFELMYRAAWGVYKAHSWSGSTAIVVGSGNNGGDGFALACILKEKGHSCAVFTVSERLSSDSAYYAEKARTAAVPVFPYENGCLTGFDTVVDCLLGTGFQGKLRENYRAAIESINESDAFVISVDINSGMNGDTGEAELAVNSDLTVTIGYVKTGMIRKNAGKYMKQLVCADIGIVLPKEDGWVCAADAPLASNTYRCPQWLRMEPISAKNTAE